MSADSLRACAVEFRHLRCFVVLAEELHFGRAAERLHIEQSPLSCTIKELEDRLGARLFNRDRRGTRLTHTGEVFLNDVRRVLCTLDQAKENAKATASGACGLLRIAVSEGPAQPRLAALLALCREEEPGVEVRLIEVPLSEQLRGLRNGAFDASFAHVADAGDGIDVYPVWTDPIVAAVPSRHALLQHSRIPIEDLLRHPLIPCRPDACQGCRRQVEQILCSANVEPKVAERTSSLDMMLTLMAAGFGVGLCTAELVAARGHPDIVLCPLAVDACELTTYLLVKANAEPPARLESFISRAIRDSEGV